MTDEKIKLRYASANRFVVVLQLMDDSKTDEDRSDAVNPNFARFRTNKAKVVKIYDKVTNEEINEVQSDKLVYQKKCVIKDDYKSVEVDPTCKSGIHYYETEDAAHYHNLLKSIPDYTGLVMYHTENGLKLMETEYKNGARSGIHIEWKVLQFGKTCKILVCKYLDGKLHGGYRSYYLSGRTETQCTYKHGNLEGPFRKYYPNNKIKVFCFYVDGALHGVYREWAEQNTMHQILHYNLGIKHGISEKYYTSGNIYKRTTYKNGNKMIKSVFNEDGTQMN